MDVLGDAISRERRSDTTALRAPAVGRRYDYRRFCTSAWKVGNFLRYLGVRSGVGVTIADDPLPEPVLSLYGAALLGGVVTFGPSDRVDDARALIVPADRLDDHGVGPGTKRIAYGDRPGDPDVAYFERDVWSENPTMSPDRIAPTDPLLATGDAAYSHGEVLATAVRIAEERDIEVGDEVSVRGSFADPGVVVAGLITPIVAGASIVLGADGDLVVGGERSDIDTATLLG